MAAMAAVARCSASEQEKLRQPRRSSGRSSDAAVTARPMAAEDGRSTATKSEAALGGYAHAELVRIVKKRRRRRRR